MNLYYRQIVLVRGTKIKLYGEYIYSATNWSNRYQKGALNRIFRIVQLRDFPRRRGFPEKETLYRFYERDLSIDEYYDFKEEQKKYDRKIPWRYFNHCPDLPEEEEEE